MVEEIGSEEYLPDTSWVDSLDLESRTNLTLNLLEVRIKKIREDRYVLDNAKAIAEEQSKKISRALGRKEGDRWSQPESWEGYAKGDIVTYRGKKYVSTVAHNVWKPGVANWEEVPSKDGTPPNWRKSTGATDAYKKGSKVTYNGSVYESLIDSNVWSPDEYPQGWKKL